MAHQKPKKMTLGGFEKLLVDKGLIEEKEALRAQVYAVKESTPYIAYIVKKNLVDSRKLAMLASKTFGMPVFDLSAFDLERVPTSILNPKIIERHRALPIFKRGNMLFVAISDPTNIRGLDEIKFQTGAAVEGIIVEDDKLAKTIDKIMSKQEVASLGDISDEALDGINIESDLDKETEDTGDVEDAPIVRFVNKVLLDAVNSSASDIHFEPYERLFRVRLRQDGILHEYATPPINLAPRISTRLKVISSLDISERRVPQDGRFKMKISKNRAIDFRVSTCPTMFGEKVVMRILDPSSAQIGIDALGYEPFQKDLFLDAIHKPQGMVVVTGPTGSGKTVSLYTALGILNIKERNISTCEDPVEIYMQGINQVNVNNRAGLDFAVALRAFLRQDPDVIMVGEIRDLETAEIGIKAAQTGHMVLSTLHTNSAADSLTRLINMGIPSYNLATSINLVIAQRLVRKLCEYCRTKADIPDHAKVEAGFPESEVANIQIYKAKGCDRCVQGYKGRIGIYELLPVTPDIGRIVMQGGNALDIFNQAIKNGMWDLKRSGLEKVKKGMTTLEELSRVIKD